MQRKIMGGLAGVGIFVVFLVIGGLAASFAEDHGLADRLATKIGVALALLGLGAGYKAFEVISVPPPSETASFTSPNEPPGNAG